MNINNRLRKIRKEKKLTIQEFSTLIDVPENTISNYERAVRKPSVEYIQILIDKLDANPRWILTGQGEMFLSQEAISLSNLKEKYNLTNEELKLLNELLTSPEKRQALLNLLK